MSSIEINVPSSLSDIKLGDWLRYRRLVLADNITDSIKRVALVTIFCKISVEDVMNIPISEIREISDQIETVLEFKPVFVQRFTMPIQVTKRYRRFGVGRARLRTVTKNVEFGFIPNLDEMTGAEYMDLDSYFEDEENWPRALAICYRPIEGKFGELYNLEPYEGSDKYREAMLNVSMDVVQGWRVFFYRLNRALLKHTIDYSIREAALNPEIKTFLESSFPNGDGIIASTSSLEGMFSNMETSLSSRFTLSLPK